MYRIYSLSNKPVAIQVLNFFNFVILCVLVTLWQLKIINKKTTGYG